ncbi:MAG: hypothetical protein BWY70_00958 [Bacteroidetes bacterium ADurb.Bin408]|nr:MAG: hypothetical protein BWY70_00958 [Bacteroidetes bacterium ADurb.Bin408]
MTYTNAMQMMYAIFMDGNSIGTSNANSIQGNTISNISFTSSSTSMGFTGIRVGKGIYNIGNVSGNIIGATTDIGSIYYYGSGGSTTYHIFTASIFTMQPVLQLQTTLVITLLAVLQSGRPILSLSVFAPQPLTYLARLKTTR